MLSGVQFGPRIECFDEVKVSPQISADVQSERVKRRNEDAKGKFTIFDDEPVAITPSHPLAQQKTELSEVWTRKNEDLDWDYLTNSESIASRRKKMNNHDMLEDLISLKLTKSWNVAMDTETTSISKQSKSGSKRSTATDSKEATTSTKSVSTDESFRPSHAESTAPSTTGLEDSRMTFPLHDLTGVVKTKEREAELMRYMGVNNLNFDIAKRHAPKDKGKPAFGLIKEGVFKAYPKGSSSSKTAVQERLIPDPERTKAKELATRANMKSEQGKEAEGSKTQTGNLESLVRLLSQSRADLLCSATDGHAIFESAERMTKEANDWFLKELNGLEKSIKDERSLGNKFTRNLNQTLHKIIEKICDLELLYETLDFLENKMKVAEKTIASSQENMRNARKILAQLTATDYKKTTPQTDSNTGDSNLAADAATAFYKLEQILPKIAPFVARSSLASTLIDSVTDQMRGIRKAVTEEVPRRALSEYNAKVKNDNPKVSKTSLFMAKPAPNAAHYELFKKPRRKKFCSYIKLDPWPTEADSVNADPDAVSSSTILSAESTTLPLSDYHESARSRTPSKSSLQEGDLYAAFDAKKGASSDDYPPTAVGSRVCTSSAASACPTFEEAELIPNSNLLKESARSKGSSCLAGTSTTRTSVMSMPTTATSAAFSGTFTGNSTATSRAKSSVSDLSDLKTARATLSAKTVASAKSAVRRTPDPIKSHFKNKRAKGALDLWGDAQARREKMIVNNQEYLEKNPLETSSTVTANTQYSDHAIEQNTQ